MYGWRRRRSMADVLLYNSFSLASPLRNLCISWLYGPWTAEMQAVVQTCLLLAAWHQKQATKHLASRDIEQFSWFNNFPSELSIYFVLCSECNWIEIWIGDGVLDSEYCLLLLLAPLPWSWTYATDTAYQLFRFNNIIFFVGREMRKWICMVERWDSRPS